MLNNQVEYFEMHPRISKGGSVRTSVRPSVRPSVISLLFRRFASGFCINAPAQSHATDAVVYTASPTAPLFALVIGGCDGAAAPKNGLPTDRPTD